MNENAEYQAMVKALESTTDGQAERLQGCVRLLHVAIGVATEAGELLDQIKRHIYYGAPLDITNVVEELGDLLWYITLGSDSVGLDLDQIRDANARKLKARYGDRFSRGRAVERDVGNEINELLNPVINDNAIYTGDHPEITECKPWPPEESAKETQGNGADLNRTKEAFKKHEQKETQCQIK